ncbi:FAD-dependent oxidoreductase [Embleya sp. NBC_00896]|uniref:FAD-dependent oxidoreductase n=1 Tax=Embleya sp. NBC_00896 TaxID=2975961 RepID=UPI00386E07BB|nr:FAD-dependent oxidoreductase [Embleya sp. NBC_00896]
MTHDLVVIGAGPAGLTAAVTAARFGLRVAVVDANSRAGGQYHRHRAGHAPDWPALARLHTVEHLAGHRVWALERADDHFAVHAAAGERDTRPVTVRGRRLLLATGAYDRQLPFPGWDLPGVFTAGGAQALLKGNGVAPGRRALVAGTGPFLLPVAVGLADAGVEVLGVLEAARPTPRAAALAPHSPARVVEAAGYAAALARRRIPYLTGRAVIAARGDDAGLRAVTVARLDADWRPRPGTGYELACDTLAVGYGFTPQLELATQLGCANTPDGFVTVDARQATSVPGLYAAGETTGIGGAQLSAVEGELSAYAIAGRTPPRGLLRRRARLTRFAAGLRELYPVRPGWLTWLGADTLVCRCEEVTRDRITHAVRSGADDVRAVKLLTRAGMGWCQGRMCAEATACVLADALDRPITPAPPSRPIAQPIRLGDLAQGAP